VAASGAVAPGSDSATGLDRAASRLAGRVLGLLPECREPGTRAAGPVPDASALARQFLADLDAEVSLGEPGRP